MEAPLNKNQRKKLRRKQAALLKEKEAAEIAMTEQQKIE